MNLSLQFTKAAQSDLEDIYDYTLRTWGQQQADAYLDGLRRHLESLVVDHGLCRRLTEWRTDGFFARYERHAVFFISDETTLLVVRVLHERRDFLRHLLTQT